MLKQYWSVRNRLDEDTLLFFRMGDFYELFFKDAEIASRELGITLTSRKTGGASYPLAGVPIRAADTYIARLVKKGYKVAIVEQTEDPSLAKGVVKRDHVRIITRGTIVEEGVLEEDQNNYLVAILVKPLKSKQKEAALVATDVSTGEIWYACFSGDQAIDTLQGEIARLNPSELLLPRSYEQNPDSFLGFSLEPGINITFVEDYWFESSLAVPKIQETWNVSGVEGFGLKPESVATGVLGAVLRYLEENFLTTVSNLRVPRVINPSEYLILDKTAISSLEITKNIFDESTNATLLSIFDQVITPMGSRKLVHSLLKPLRSRKKIEERLNAVEALMRNAVEHHNLRAALETIADLERLSSRIVLGTARPPDLVAIRNSLSSFPLIKDILEQFNDSLLKSFAKRLDVCEDIVSLLDRALLDEPSRLLNEGGIIKPGFNEELDKYRSIQAKGSKLLQEYQEKERVRTGIPSLKVGYNKVFGHYIEVTKPHLAKVPPEYVRKQSLTNAERFITEELRTLEESILSADEKAKQLEEKLFLEIRKSVKEQVKRIQDGAEIISLVDVLSCFARVSEDNDFVKPVVDDSDENYVEEGRHPVLERILSPDPFVPNSVHLNRQDSRLLIITGPNLSGKSTYLRQTALIIIMAQAGCFVPAKSARIGIVDRIFTRIGAFDNIARGQSTFMLEMQECANILHNATGRSFVILDEIGRGTSTFDGLSIAWAIAEALHDMKNPPRVMLATHYHQLAQLEKIKPGVKNYHSKIEIHGDQIRFIRKILPGSTDRSFGIQVAALAGIPRYVTNRAKKIMEVIVSGSADPATIPTQVMEQTSHEGQPLQATLLDFLGDSVMEQPTEPSPASVSISKKELEVLATLRTVNINTLTPLQALNILAELQQFLQS